MQVNHKRVARIMRKDNLLAPQPKCFKVTTNSNLKFDIYLNLAARMKLTGTNQLWVADLTYIRLKAEFVYLAVILNGFSGKGGGMGIGSYPGDAAHRRSAGETDNRAPASCVIRIEGCNTLAGNI